MEEFYNDIHYSLNIKPLSCTTQNRKARQIFIINPTSNLLLEVWTVECMSFTIAQYHLSINNLWSKIDKHVLDQFLILCMCLKPVSYITYEGSASTLHLAYNVLPHSSICNIYNIFLTQTCGSPLHKGVAQILANQQGQPIHQRRHMSMHTWQ